MKLVPKRNVPIKAKSGWKIFLNPKNWGVKDIDKKEFKDAFAEARRSGLDEFMWNNNRYNTKLISNKSLKSFDDLYNWLKSYLKNNFDTNNITLSSLDSTNLRLLDSNRRDSIYNYLKDSLSNLNLKKDLIMSLLYSPKNYERFKSKPDSVLVKKELQKRYKDVLDKLDNLKTGNIVITDLPNKDDSTMGYVLPNTGKIYININNPGTAVHELSHYSEADKLLGIPSYFFNSAENNNEYNNYLLNPREIAARLYLYKYLQSPNLKIDRNKYNNMNFNGLVDKILYYNWDDFNKNFKVK